MSSRWQTYLITLLGIWFYTTLVFMVHSATQMSFHDAILAVALGWSFVNLLLTYLLSKDQ